MKKEKKLKFDSCKYDHTEQIRTNDLLDKILKLEKQNMMLRDINQQQEYAIYVLNDRLSNVETEEKSKSFKCSSKLYNTWGFRL